MTDTRHLGTMVICNSKAQGSACLDDQARSPGRCDDAGEGAAMALQREVEALNTLKNGV
jgi:hypothetical protein